MNLADAIDRVSLIHEHIAKGEVYRGARPLPILVAGVIAAAAAALQPLAVDAGDLTGFARYWIIVGIAGAAVSASEIGFNYAVREDRFARRRTRQVVAQLGVAIGAAAAVTMALGRDAATIPLLPGLWALIFGLGIMAVRPYAPRGTGWIAAFYIAAGAALLWLVMDASQLSGWMVGGTFGLGQCAAALVMHLDLARGDHG